MRSQAATLGQLVADVGVSFLATPRDVNTTLRCRAAGSRFMKEPLVAMTVSAPLAAAESKPLLVAEIATQCCFLGPYLPATLSLWMHPDTSS